MRLRRRINLNIVIDCFRWCERVSCRIGVSVTRDFKSFLFLFKLLEKESNNKIEKGVDPGRVKKKFSRTP